MAEKVTLTRLGLLKSLYIPLDYTPSGAAGLTLYLEHQLIFGALVKGFDYFIDQSDFSG